MTKLDRFEGMWAITAAGWFAGLAFFPWVMQSQVSILAIVLLAIIGAVVSPMMGTGVLSLIAQIQDDVLYNDRRRPDAFLPAALGAAVLAFLTVVIALLILSQ